jgi:hypothetical protein
MGRESRDFIIESISLSRISLPVECGDDTCFLLPNLAHFINASTSQTNGSSTRRGYYSGFSSIFTFG